MKDDLVSLQPAFRNINVVEKVEMQLQLYLVLAYVLTGYTK